MGRRAKYFTREERLEARKAQRALKESQPGWKEKRSEENRQAWRKKQALKLLNQGPPLVSQRVRDLSEEEISGGDYESWYHQFREGRDCLGLDEVDIEVEELECLTSSPPYPTSVTRVSSFSEDWPLISAVLHGYSARKYIEHCDTLIDLCRRAPQHGIISRLYEEYRGLVLHWSRLDDAMKHFRSPEDQEEIYITTQNIRWTSRLLLYKVEDIGELGKGVGNLVNAIIERRWRIEHGGSL
ncbi:hypothetical protein NMY22_g8220 [Coprinellus aureogranulatus]|nr:hypothetical protein NMY22_g8220 [Coprinellus aureogranulatus]